MITYLVLSADDAFLTIIQDGRDYMLSSLRMATTFCDNPNGLEQAQRFANRFKVKVIRVACECKEIG